MAALGFSLDNLSLMALSIARGFIVDDAIVMIENIVRYIEAGDRPIDAALKGSRQIGFTIVSLTISLIAVFIPLLLMGGVVGRLFREFSITLSVAIVISGVLSLILTPMMCATLLKREDPANRGWFYRNTERAFDAMRAVYEAGLIWSLRHSTSDADAHRSHFRRQHLALRPRSERASCPSRTPALSAASPTRRRTFRSRTCRSCSGGSPKSSPAIRTSSASRASSESARTIRPSTAAASISTSDRRTAEVRQPRKSWQRLHRCGRRRARYLAASAAGAGHPDREPADAHAIPVRASAPRRERASPVGRQVPPRTAKAAGISPTSRRTSRTSASR